MIWMLGRTSEAVNHLSGIEDHPYYIGPSFIVVLFCYSLVTQQASVTPSPNSDSSPLDSYSLSLGIPMSRYEYQLGPESRWSILLTLICYPLVTQQASVWPRHMTPVLCPSILVLSFSASHGHANNTRRAFSSEDPFCWPCYATCQRRDVAITADSFCPSATPAATCSTNTQQANVKGCIDSDGSVFGSGTRF